jgi:MFS family permease
MLRGNSSGSTAGLQAAGERHLESRSLRSVSTCSLGGLDWLNFILADVQSGVGPFLAIYLAARGWNVERVGIALTVAGFAGIIAQTPAGALVDRLRWKRALIAMGVLAVAGGALLIAFAPWFWPVMAAQVLIGAMSSFFMPAIAAISLGLVGHRLFDARQGRNQTFNSAGNAAAAVLIGLIGYFISNRAIFFFVALLAFPTIFSLTLIRPHEIDYELARGADSRKEGGPPARLIRLLRDHPLVIFLCCAVPFHFANAAMLPLLGEMLSRGKGRSSMAFMSACVITTQLTIALIAWHVGAAASRWGRKPLLLIGFTALPIRGVLYTFTGNAYLLVSIQVLDGIGVGIFGVVSAIVVADLTRGTGRFNLTLGVIATAIGAGAALSQTVAGSIVRRYGYNTGFLFLACVAAAALLTLWALMPETLGWKPYETAPNDDLAPNSGGPES